jgi:hypothetical protein
MNCAFEHGTKCVALTDKDCIGCHFKKTREELAEGRKRARMLLARLPEEQQKEIRKKYPPIKERK